MLNWPPIQHSAFNIQHSRLSEGKKRERAIHPSSLRPHPSSTRPHPFALIPLLLFASMCASTPKLTLEEKIGQLFVAPAHGTFMAESSASYQQLVHQVRDNHAGGLIWFSSNVYETALLNQRLQQQTKIPLLISADLESGIG